MGAIPWIIGVSVFLAIVCVIAVHKREAVADTYARVISVVEHRFTVNYVPRDDALVRNHLIRTEENTEAKRSLVETQVPEKWSLAKLTFTDEDQRSFDEFKRKADEWKKRHGDVVPALRRGSTAERLLSTDVASARIIDSADSEPKLDPTDVGNKLGATIVSKG
jgi:hypothetical protein